jgi:hypothetical protein
MSKPWPMPKIATASLLRDRIEALEMIIREARIQLEQGLRGDALKTLRSAFPEEHHVSPIQPNDGYAA